MGGGGGGLKSLPPARSLCHIYTCYISIQIYEHFRDEIKMTYDVFRHTIRCLSPHRKAKTSPTTYLTSGSVMVVTPCFDHLRIGSFTRWWPSENRRATM